MVDPQTNIGGDLNRMNESDLISESVVEEYTPIQTNPKLFKFILYTSKVEIKYNSLVKLIYNTSLIEIGIWIFGFLLFCVVPKEMYLIWVLIIHLVKGFLGIFLLRKMPKTFEIIENIAKNPNFEESKIIDLIKTQIKESFIEKWEKNKSKFFAYLVVNVICILLDFTILIIQIACFKGNYWKLVNTCMIFVIILFIISDVIYFLWFFTLGFSLPQDVLIPVKNAILGSVGDLKNFALGKLGRGVVQS